MENSAQRLQHSRNKTDSITVKEHSIERQEGIEGTDEVDVRYALTGAHYDSYTMAKKLMKKGQNDFEDALVGMDTKILKRIRENEREYHGQVTKFLSEKENELRTVLRRLEKKNLNTDGKDQVIANLRAFITKIESDGQELLRHLRKGEEEIRKFKARSGEDEQDRSFMQSSLKKAKSQVRQQNSALEQLKNENFQLKKALTSKDDEIKALELKVLRLQSFDKRTGSNSQIDSFGVEMPLEEIPSDSVMVTQRGLKLAVENKDSVYCPFTQNSKFETFLEDIFDMRISQLSIRRQIQDYVKCIETHYMDIIQKLKMRARKIEIEAIKKIGVTANRQDKRSQLEEILMDAIDKTRLQVFKRRLAQERFIKQQAKTSRVKQLGNELSQQQAATSEFRHLDSDALTSIEPTLMRLNQYVNQQVKYADFTAEDKANLVELFVTHQATLTAIYFAIFPKTTQIEKAYDNLNLVGFPEPAGRNPTADESLQESLLYNENEFGSISDEHVGTRLPSQQYHEHRSVSELGKYENSQPRRLETMRNESHTTVGMHEIRSTASSKYAPPSSLQQQQQYNLHAVMSQKRLKLPSLGRNNIEISTNPSTMRKDKRSLSTMRGVQTNSRANLTNDNVSNFVMHRDNSVGTIRPVIDASNSKLQANVSRMSTGRNTIAHQPDLSKFMAVQPITKPSMLGRNTLEELERSQRVSANHYESAIKSQPKAARIKLKSFIEPVASAQEGEVDNYMTSTHHIDSIPETDAMQTLRLEATHHSAKKSNGLNSTSPSKNSRTFMNQGSSSITQKRDGTEKLTNIVVKGFEQQSPKGQQNASGQFRIIRSVRGDVPTATLTQNNSREELSSQMETFDNHALATKYSKN